MSSVSVIICAYTEERLVDIREAVASLERQTRQPEEIILAIDNNRALYETVRHEFGEAVNVVLNQAVKGLSATRNAGIAATRGDLIAFLDDDAVAEPDWLERLLGHFDNPRVRAAGGRSVLAWARGRPAWFPEDLDWTVGGSFTWLPLRTAEVANPHGHNMCFRREAFSSVGMFETVLGRHGQGGQGGEERELCLRLADRFPDSQIIYEPAALIRHKVPTMRSRWGYLVKRSYGEGISKVYIQQVSRTYARTPLSTENDYLRYLLLQAVPRRLVRFWRLVELIQVAAILLSIAAVGIGYIVGRWRFRDIAALTSQAK
jgi:glycosyltransferase involved in cell wall biosynthesis